MHTKIRHRLLEIRELMAIHGIDVLIVPHSDPHKSEYLPPYWKYLEWISGFTGSSGCCIITQTSAGLWTDSRYFIQAEQQLKGTTFKLFRDGLKDTISIKHYIQENLNKGDTISICSELVTITLWNSLLQDFNDFTLRGDLDIIGLAWDKNRPPQPDAPIFIYDTQYCGEDAANKMARIRDKIPIDINTALVVSTLDDIAWTLNIRGNEIPNNPVVISHLIIERKTATLFINSHKLTDELHQYLSRLNIKIREYCEFYNFLSNLSLNKVFIDPNTTNRKVLESISRECVHYINSPIPLLKAIRNSVEIDNLNNAMLKDGVAMVRFLIWLEHNINNAPTELDIVKQLHQFRKEQTNFKGDSFDTIAGYKENGAIVHYKPTKESSTKLYPESFLLLDSGAQYLEGTTDITRTISLGALSQEEREDYTLVLKGHINLATAIFPKGTRGSQLDILARHPLWKQRKNYLHGTGHGVGHFLCVHEGPQSIRTQENSTCIEEGMVISNEPGSYNKDKFGVRIENLMLTKTLINKDEDDFICFKTVTLCPIDVKPIYRELLTTEEVTWLNSYHKMVYKELSPLLNQNEKEWLKNNTKEI